MKKKIYEVTIRFEQSDRLYPESLEAALEETLSGEFYSISFKDISNIHYVDTSAKDTVE
jgi:hypothetical protein